MIVIRFLARILRGPGGCGRTAGVRSHKEPLNDTHHQSTNRTAPRQRQRAAIDRQDQVLDFKPAVKLFTPDAQCTWLLTEIDEGTDLAFGLCDLGLGCPELGYVSLVELCTVRGKLGLPVERDLHFDANKTISAYADEARSRGHIVT